MADVNPIQGPIAPKEDPNKRDVKKIGTPEKFKESYRVQAIKESDAEQQKKRKRREETENENLSVQIQGPLSSAPSENVEPSPFAIQPPSKPSAAPSSDTPPSVTPSLGSSYTPSGPEDVGEEGSLYAEDTLPGPQQPYATQPQEPQQPQPVQQAAAQPLSFSEDDFYSDEMTPQYVEPSSTATPQPAAEPETSQQPAPSAQKTQQAQDTPTHLKPQAEHKDTKKVAASDEKTRKTSEIKLHEKKGEVKEKAITKPTPQQHPQHSELEIEKINIQPTALAPFAQAPVKTKDVTAEEAGVSWQEGEHPVQALSAESSGGEKKDQEKKEDQAPSSIQPVSVEPPTPFSLDVSAPQGPLPSYTTFRADLLEMFEKMVGTISILQESKGERKTTITLTSPNFSSSAFYGAEIVIEEDLHLAPGQYNIKLIASPEAVNLFQAKSDDLLAAFQSGNYNFRVQRIETSLQPVDKPLFKRKEKAGDKGDTGDNQEQPS
jgi:hypothetical protein